MYIYAYINFVYIVGDSFSPARYCQLSPHDIFVIMVSGEGVDYRWQAVMVKLNWYFRVEGILNKE